MGELIFPTRAAEVAILSVQAPQIDILVFPFWSENQICKISQLLKMPITTDN